MEDVLTKPSKLSSWQSLLFSFFSLYFFFYIFPFPVGYNGNLDSLTTGYYKAFNTLIVWFGHIFFHRSITNITDNGSGDRAFNYVQAFTMFVLALIGIIIWYFFVKRKSATRILYWLYLYTQLYLSVTLVRYGLEKIIKAQFPFPYYGLTETYAESSPMRLMINFMGYSTSYNLFTGAIEVITGWLILFRKTSLTGALIAVAALSNILLMNIGYDVPIKLHVCNLLLMALYIATPFAGSLCHLFVSDKPIHHTTNPDSFIYHKKRNPVVTGGMMLLASLLLYSNLQLTRLKYKTNGDGAFENTPLFGIYNVRTFIKNNDTLLPLITDTSQWKTLSIIYKKRATVRMMNDSTNQCRFVTDTSTKTMVLTDQDDTAYQANFIYKQPDAMHLVLNGKVKNDSVEIWLEKQDMKKFRLVNHEFHWIHESLDNR